MRLLKQLDIIGGYIFIAVWHAIKFIFAIVVVGIPLVLLAKWCFPGFTDILNKEITANLVKNLVENKKFNEAIWLINQKEKTIEDFNDCNLYTIRGYELKAQMAVGNFKSAERCIEQMDSIMKESQKKRGLNSKVYYMHDLQKTLLYFKMNNHTKVQQICSDYYKNPVKRQKEIEQLISSTKCDIENDEDFAKTYVNQLRLIYLRSITMLDYSKGSILFKEEINKSQSDPLRQMNLYRNWSLCAMKVDSTQDARRCYNFIKEHLITNNKILKDSKPKALADFLLLGSYLHDEKSAQVVLPYLEENIDNDYNDEELGYHEAIACCIPYWDMNDDFKKANDALERQSEFLTDMLSRNFLFYGEEQRENIYMMYRPILEASFTHLSKDGSDKAATIAYNNILFTKGLLLRSSEQILHAVEQSNDKKSKYLYETLLDQKKKQMEYESLGGLLNNYKLSQLKPQIADTEEQLSSLCYQYRLSLAKNKMSYKDVRQKLQKDEACIEFVLDNNGVYYALIGRIDYKYPKVVQLMDNNSIIKFLESDVYHNNTFAKELWTGISTHLKGVNTVYYSPVGELNRISFDALPYEKATLFDKYNLVMVSSTSEIHTHQTQRYTTATIMGDVRYSATDSLILANVTSSVKSGGKHNFLMPLGDDETNDVYQMLKYKGVKTHLYTRLDASEDNLKSLSGRSTDIIHISTHGFYDSTFSLKPMKNSGLFLAGANRCWYYNESVQTKEDGIVTADEIATINLSKCKLVVLSACETGLGNIDNSEGVFGLQRAFKLAGVQSLMMSLWKVDNEATTLLMTTFYREWLNKGDMDKAFKKARQTVRDEFHDPYYWAGFVMLDENYN